MILVGLTHNALTESEPTKKRLAEPGWKPSAYERTVRKLRGSRGEGMDIATVAPWTSRTLLPGRIPIKESTKRALCMGEYCTLSAQYTGLRAFCKPKMNNCQFRREIFLESDHQTLKKGNHSMKQSSVMDADQCSALTILYTENQLSHWYKATVPGWSPGLLRAEHNTAFKSRSSSSAQHTNRVFFFKMLRLCSHEPPQVSDVDSPISDWVSCSCAPADSTTT